MSDLVEKVTAAINGGFTESDHAREKARAAIKAVAEWLDTVMEDRVAASDLMKQLKEGSE